VSGNAYGFAPDRAAPATGRRGGAPAVASSATTPVEAESWRPSFAGTAVAVAPAATTVALAPPPPPVVDRIPAPVFDPVPGPVPERADDPEIELADLPMVEPVDDRPANQRPVQRSSARRALGAARAFVMAALLGTVVAVVGMFLLSIPLGFRSLTVMSGSMVPTLGVGDVVVEHEVAPLDVRVGDIVTFRDPTDQSTLITHRVRSFKVHDGTVEVVTKGDANNTVEKWTIPVNGKLGVVVLHIPKLGYALVWASGRTGRIALIAVPGILLGALELKRIWRPRRSPA